MTTLKRISQLKSKISLHQELENTTRVELLKSELKILKACQSHFDATGIDLTPKQLLKN